MFSEDLEPRGGILSRLRVASDALEGYLGMVSDEGKEFVLRKGRDVDGRGDGVGTLEDGGGKICYNKEVV